MMQMRARRRRLRAYRTAQINILHEPRDCGCAKRSPCFASLAMIARHRAAAAQSATQGNAG